MPIDPSSMARWRKRLGDAGTEQMLRATIEAGMKMRVIRPAELKGVNRLPNPGTAEMRRTGNVWNIGLITANAAIRAAIPWG